MRNQTLSYVAIIVAIIAGIFGIFGGIPGIKTLFFSKPSLKIIGFMPAVVFDPGYNLDSTNPKFSLKGIIKITNPNSYDITIREMKLYGRSTDTSGKYKQGGNKPLVYELNVVGTLDSEEDLIKAYSSAYLKFNFAYFKNTEPPGVMKAPMKGSGSAEKGELVFYIYLPSFNQLFKYNNRRAPYQMVDEVAQGQLIFSAIFNNELLKVNKESLYTLRSFQKNEWENDSHIINMFNAAGELDIKK